MWSDQRLDDLNHKVDDLRVELRDQSKALRTEMAQLRTELHSEIKDLRADMDRRFDAVQRSMLTLTAALSGTMIAGFASILATQL